MWRQVAEDISSAHFHRRFTPLRELHGDKRYASIPIVVVTGCDDIVAAVAQSRAILRKPVAPETLLSVIEAHLDAA